MSKLIPLALLSFIAAPAFAEDEETAPSTPVEEVDDSYARQEAKHEAWEQEYDEKYGDDWSISGTAIGVTGIVHGVATANPMEVLGGAHMAASNFNTAAEKMDSYAKRPETAKDKKAREDLKKHMDEVDTINEAYRLEKELERKNKAVTPAKPKSPTVTPSAGPYRAPSKPSPSSSKPSASKPSPSPKPTAKPVSRPSSSTAKPVAGSSPQRPTAEERAREAAARERLKNSRGRR